MSKNLRLLSIIAFLFLSPFFSWAQTQFWSDTFENTAPSAGTRNPSIEQGIGGPPYTAYFLRTNGSDINLNAPVDSGSPISYQNFEGSKFWAGEDLDNTGLWGIKIQTITWSSINISGKSGLSIKGLFAASNDRDWQNFNFGPTYDFMEVEYSIDGGSWTLAGGIYPDASNGIYGRLRQDTNGDKIGDGSVLLSRYFQEFVWNIAGTGATLDLRFKVSADASAVQEFAIDNFRLFTSSSSNTVPTATSVSHTGTLTIGQTLTGSYTYADADNNTENGSTFKWYRSNDAAGTGKTAITSATSSTYTLVAEDVGKYISFEVTPKDGTAFGTAVESTRRGPVIASYEFFEGATATTKTFTNTTTGLNFTLTNKLAVQNYPGYGVHANSTPSSTLGSNFYIGNDGNTGANQINSIKSTDKTPFTVKSMWIYLSSNVSGTPPTNNGTITFTGKKNGVTQYTFTKSGIFQTSVSLGSNYNGFTLVDFSADTDNSNTLIDELEINLGSVYQYIAIDNFAFSATPSLTNTTATAVTGTTATLNADVNPSASITSAISFDYSTSPTLATGVTNVVATPATLVSGNSANAVSANISELTVGKTYYYRAKATNGVGTNDNSEIKSFSTPTSGVLLSSNPTLSFSNATGLGDNIVSDGESGSTAISDLNLHIYAINSSGTLLSDEALEIHGSDWGYPSVLTYGGEASATCYGWTIKSSDGSNFSLESLDFFDWGNWTGEIFAAEAFDNGLSKGKITFTGNKTASYIPLIAGGKLSSAFKNIDEIRLYQDDGSESYIGFNNIQIGPATDIPNTPPTATSVSTTGTAKVGQTLTGTYTYTDNDTESGSTYKWYRSDDALGTNKTTISSATSQTYTLIALDAGKYISFEVTPNDGTATGTAVESDKIGPVIALPIRVYVNKNIAGGNNSGNSWANAKKELADALKEMKINNEVGEIWVAGGTYKPKYSPQDGANFGTDKGRDNTFLLVKDVKVYGGFAGTEISLTERDLSLTANASILSGDIDNNDASDGTITGNNTYHVVISSGNAGTATLNGFTINGGYADGGGNTITVNGNSIKQNSGAGIYNNLSNLLIEAVTIAYNSTNGGDGAGVCNVSSNSKIVNSLIHHNGGSTYRGGGVYSATSAPELINVTIANNTNNINQGAVFNDGVGAIIKNSIIWGNSGTSGISGNGATVSNSIIQGGYAGTSILNADPKFINTSTGNYTLSSSSPAVNKGSNTLFTGLDVNTKDLAGNARVYQYASSGIVDMGAYELQSNATAAIIAVDLPTNKTYITGDELNFTIKFSDNVTVTKTVGTPSLALTIGSVSRNATYDSGSGTGDLVFKYTVQPGDLDTNGITIGTLALNGGTIKDAADNNATLTLASIGSTSGIRIDAVAPSVTAVSSSTNGTYKIGSIVPITVAFNEAVTVTGTPQLTLETGTTDRVVNYASGSGTSILTFNYTVQVGDTTADLDYSSTVALSLNGGTVRDTAGNNAVLTLASPGTAGSLGLNANLVIDGIAPTVTISSNVSTLKREETAIITFTFSEAPGATFTWDGNNGDITISGGTLSAIDGSNTIYTATFTPTDDTDGGTASITIVANSYTDVAGNGGTAGTTPSLNFDTKAPTITVATLALSNDSGSSGADFITNVAAQTISGTLSANLQTGEIVEVSLNNGNSWTTATTATGQNTYTLSGVTLTGNNTIKVRIKDGAGNIGTALSKEYKLDTIAPALPTNLEVIASNQQNNLNWTANSETDLASYKVYGGTSANPTDLLKTVSTPIASFTHTNLNNGTFYYYRITAVDNAGNESSYSTEESAKPQSPQTITFATLPVKKISDIDFDPAATASSGLSVTYSSDNTAVATIANNKIHLVGIGTATIEATQAGNNEFLEATPVSQVITVLGPPSFTSTPVTEIDYNAPYEYSVSATTEGDLLTNIQATTLPSWLSLGAGGYLSKSLATATEAPSGITTDADGNIFYSAHNGTNIYKINKNDGQVSGWGTRMPGRVYDILAFDGYLYLARTDDARITRIPLTNPAAGEEDVINGLIYPMYFSVYNNEIYVSSQQKVVKLNPSVHSYSIYLNIPGANVDGIDFDQQSGNLYYITEGPTGGVFEYNGSSSTQVIAGFAIELEKTDDGLYVSGGGIKKYKNDFSLEATIVNSGSVTGLTKDATGKIVYSNMTTKDVATIVSGSMLSGTAGQANVGVHAVSLKAMNDAGSTSQNFSITVKGPATLSNFSDLNKTYGDAAFELATPSSNNTSGIFTYTSSNPAVASVNGQMVTIHKVGTVTITAKQAAYDYFTEATIVATLTVNPKNITVNLLNEPLITKQYDANTTSVLATENYSLQGLINEDEVNVKGTAVYDSKNAGTDKTITVNSFVLAGADKDNYTLTTIQAQTTGEIMAKPVTPKINGTITKMYDGSTSASASFSDLTSDDGVLGTDEISVSYTSATYNSKNAGTLIPVSFTGLTLTGADQNNYSISNFSASGSITTKSLTITADDKEKYEGETNPDLTASYNGFVSGEGSAVLNVQPILNTVADENSLQGTYPITISGASAQNYSISYVPGTLTIRPGAPTSVSFAGTTLYENSPEGTSAGILNSTSLSPTATYTYTLVNGAGDEDNSSFAINGTQLITAIPLNFENKQMYSIRVRSTTQYNLSLEQTFTINLEDVNEAPTLDAVADQEVCYTTARQNIALSGISAGPDAGQTVTITASSNNNTLLSELSINNNELRYRIADGQSGTAIITVIAKDNGGAANGGADEISRIFTLTINPLPVSTISSNAGNSISKGETALLTVASDNGISYNWSNATGIISGQNSATLTVRPMETTTYTVLVTNANGCQSTATYTLMVNDNYQALKAENFFTPNGDGINDGWMVENIDAYPHHTLTIFDRSGRTLYETKNYQNDWNGTVNGTDLQEGTYFYIFRFDDPKVAPKKGFITIVR